MDPSTRYESALLLIVMIGVVGLLLILGLSLTWRRYLHREQRLQERLAANREKMPEADAWSTAGQRVDEPAVQAPHERNPEREPEDAWPGDQKDDDEDDDDEYEGDGRSPWRTR